MYTFYSRTKLKKKKNEEEGRRNKQFSRKPIPQDCVLKKAVFHFFFSFSFAHQFKIYEVLSESTRLNTRAARQTVHSLKSNYSSEFEKLNSTFPIRSYFSLIFL